MELDEFQFCSVTRGNEAVSSLIMIPDDGFFPTGEVELLLSHLYLFSKVPLGSEIYFSLAKKATRL